MQKITIFNAKVDSNSYDRTILFRRNVFNRRAQNFSDTQISK